MGARSSLPRDTLGTLYSAHDGWEVPKDDLRGFFRPTSLRFFLDERDATYWMVSVHKPKEESETVFKLLAEGMLCIFIPIHDRLTELCVLY